MQTQNVIILSFDGETEAMGIAIEVCFLISAFRSIHKTDLDSKIGSFHVLKFSFIYSLHVCKSGEASILLIYVY